MSRPLKPTFLFQHEKPRPIGGVRVQRFTIRTHDKLSIQDNCISKGETVE